MNFRKTNPTIIEAHIGKPFQLSPAPFAIAFLKQRENPNAAINRNRLYVRNCSYDFKVHGVLEITSALESCEIIFPKSPRVPIVLFTQSLSSLPNLLHVWEMSPLLRDEIGELPGLVASEGLRGIS